MGAQKISLENAVLQRHGIEDYTSQMLETAPLPESHLFGSICNQDGAIREFVESLGLSLRGTINIGAAGVGKTTAVNELIRGLERLDKGEEISGPYAEAVRTYHARLSRKPRGDIIALWNPDDYYTPKIVRTERKDRSASERIEEETSSWLNELELELMTRTEALSARTLLIEKLSDEYTKQAQNDERFWQQTWNISTTTSYPRIAEPRAGPSRRTQDADSTSSDDEEHSSGQASKRRRPGTQQKNNIQRSPPAASSMQELNKGVQAIVGQLAKHFERDTLTNTLTELLADSPQQLAQPKKARDDAMTSYWSDIDGIFEKYIQALDDTGKAWTEPAITSWYGQVVKKLHSKEQHKSLHRQLENYLNALKERSQNKEKSAGRACFDLFTPTGAGVYLLQSLLDPAPLYTRDRDGIVIRKPTVVEPLDIFGDVEAPLKRDDDDQPLHHMIDIGELGYADIIVIDDELPDFVLNPTLRRAMLTYLEEGRAEVKIEQANMSYVSDCHIFANEQTNPFYRQIFQNMPPQYDHGMARRFAQIKWRSSAEHSESTIRNFPTILRQARMKIEDGAKGFTPEAANLLYQHLLAENEPIMEIPMRIGAINAALFERILQRAALRGHELVDAGDVKEFLWSQRNLAQERAIIAGTLFDVPRSGLEHTDMMIGQGNMLVVIEDEYGAVRRNHAVVTGRLGQMKSIDMDSKLTDETYIKGVLTVDTWLQRHFGPLNLEIHMRMSADGLAGNSATAVHTYAAMSALGKIPLRQDVYVTGNINDPQGHIGVIGGVYEKARGALLFHNSYRQRERLDERPLTILVPEGNVRELLRKTLFDDEMRDAIESGRMRIDTHENVWEGFEKLCGLDRKQYEPAIRSRIKELETAAIEMSYALRHPPGSDAADLDRRKPN